MLAYSNRRPSLSSRSPPSSLLPPRRPPPRSSTRLPPTQISGALSSLRREQGRRLPWHRREPGITLPISLAFLPLFFLPCRQRKPRTARRNQAVLRTRSYRCRMQLPVVPRGAKTPPPPPHAEPMLAHPLWFTHTLPSSLLPRSRF
uniref:Uncharacterized protein n=1 Tax=Zea mays TaxID=4577 RepID=C4J9F6_MAIZE|nr:unknown [Zea mays]